MTRSTAAFAAALFSLAAVSIAGCKGRPAEGTIAGRIFEAKAVAVAEGVIVVAKVGDREVGRATTDAEGRFELKVPADQEVVLEMFKADHATGLEVVTVPKNERAQFEGKVVRAGTRQVSHPMGPIVVRSDRGAVAKIPAASLVKADGTMPATMVQVKVTPIEPHKREELDALPGKPKARSGSAPGPDPLLEILAAMIVEAHEGMDELELAPGMSMELRIPVSDPFAPSTVEVFALDEATGTWASVGFGHKQRDVSGNEIYVVEVDRLGSFALARVRPAGCVHGCIADGAGARVTTTGIAEPFFATAIAGGDGCFRIDAPIGRPVQVFASTGIAASVPAIVTATGGSPDAGYLDLASCDDLGTVAVDPANVGDATCPQGYVLCGTECVDLTSDDARCGSCTTGCMDGNRCLAGTCGCPSTSLACGPTCTRVESDPASCTTCGGACGAMQECLDAACQNIACAPPLAFCGPYCTDPLTDDANCGGCGVACADAQTCVSGACAGFVQPVGNVAGQLLDDDTGLALQGTPVRVLGTAIQTMTDTSGAFMLTGVPAGIQHIENMTGGYWGHVREIAVVPEGTVTLSSTWNIKPIAQITSIETALARTFDTARGIVHATFDLGLGSPAGTEGISLTPAPTPPSFTQNFLAVWVTSPTLVTGVYTNLWFSDVVLPMTTVTPIGSAARPCVLRSQPLQNVVGNTITEVDVACGDATTISGDLCSDMVGTCPALANATLEILGASPPLTTTTNGSGVFSLPVPANVPVEFHVSAPGHWGTTHRFIVAPAGLSISHRLLTDAAYEGRLSTVLRGANPTSGTIVLQVNTPSDTGVERGALSVSSDPTLVPTRTGAPTASPTLLPSVFGQGGGAYFEFTGVLPGVVVSNVVGGACSPSDGDHTARSMPKTISYVSYACL